jgi:hypothetical protein
MPSCQSSHPADVPPISPARPPTTRSVSIHQVAKWGAAMLPLHNGAGEDPVVPLDDKAVAVLDHAVTTHVWRRKFTTRRMPDFYQRAIELIMSAYEMALIAAKLE